jgi:hypothetical protein
MHRKLATLACALACVGISTEASAAIVSLGAADTFAVLGGSTVTNTGFTYLDGDLGVSPGTAITGFYGTNENDGPGTFTGTSFQALPFSLQAQADSLTAYNFLAAQPTSLFGDLTGQNLGGLTLTPGIYNFNTSAQLTGALTLFGVGDYVFKIGSTLTTAPSSSLIFAGGADPADVFWQVGSSATLDTNTIFGGTIIADQSVSLLTNARMDGRVIALNAAVTLQSNIINAPTDAAPGPPLPIPETGVPSLLAFGLLLLVGRRRRAA